MGNILKGWIYYIDLFGKKCFNWFVVMYCKYDCDFVFWDVNVVIDIWYFCVDFRFFSISMWILGLLVFMFWSKFEY